MERLEEDKFAGDDLSRTIDVASFSEAIVRVSTYHRKDGLLASVLSTGRIASQQNQDSL
jgi:hypothetical protein